MALRFALFGAGFWSRFQLAGWRELGGVKCVALYNRTRAKAEALAAQFDVPAVYDDPHQLLCSERIDFIDVMTGAAANPTFVRLTTSGVDNLKTMRLVFAAYDSVESGQVIEL